LIAQVLELQNTLDGIYMYIYIYIYTLIDSCVADRYSLLTSLWNKYVFCLDLSQRVDSVKEENLKLRSENQVLSQYIENLMSASSVFQSTSPNTKKK
jgi:hypothetical protein